MAAEKQFALSALDMDNSSCGFDRACNRPAMNMKGKEGNLLPLDLALPAEVDAAPRVASLPGGRFVVL